MGDASICLLRDMALHYTRRHAPSSFPITVNNQVTARFTCFVIATWARSFEREREREFQYPRVALSSYAIEIKKIGNGNFFLVVDNTFTSVGNNDDQNLIGSCSYEYSKSDQI